MFEESLNQDSIDWLLKNAGSVIRYRTAVELLGRSDPETVEPLKKDLLSSSLLQSWLGYLRPNFGVNVMHSSKSVAFENVMGKLYEFGLRKGMKVLDEKTEPFCRWLAKQLSLPNKGYFPVFYRTLVASFLSMTGYSDEDVVNTMILHRLRTVYPFAKKGDLDNVYIPQDTFPGFPKAFRGSPLINPDLYPNDEMKLPWIHDINAFLHSRPIMEDAQLRMKVETIIKFILKPEYQKLSPGYGTIRKESGRYYAMGWSVHLPGYFESDVGKVHPYQFSAHPDNPTHPCFLLRLSMMSRSETAREHPWFRRSLSMLESFRTEDRLFAFPRYLLPEKKVGYWISGRRLGLESNRRTKRAIKCESTFRYLEISAHASFDRSTQQ